MKHTHLLKLAILPLFAFLALGSSSPKKESSKSTSTTTTTTTTTTTASTGKVLGSCMQTDQSSCNELYDFGIATEDQKKKSCEKLHGTYQSATACPTKDTLLGVCSESSLLDSTQLREKIFYYDEGKNKDSGGQSSARSVCSVSMGSWADHPGYRAPAAAAAAPAPAPAAKEPKIGAKVAVKKKKK